MCCLKTNAWHPPPVSKVLSLRWSLLKENELPPFVGTVLFLCTCITPISVRSLWEFRHILIIILIQFHFVFFYLFIPNKFNKIINLIIAQENALFFEIKHSKSIALSKILLIGKPMNKPNFGFQIYYSIEKKKTISCKF